MYKKLLLIILSVMIGLGMQSVAKTYTYYPANGDELKQALSFISSKRDTIRQDTVQIFLKSGVYDLGTEPRAPYVVRCHFSMKGPVGVKDSELPIIKFRYNINRYNAYFDIGNMNDPIRNYDMEFANLKMVFPESFREITENTEQWMLLCVRNLEGFKMYNVTLEQQVSDRLILADFTQCSNVDINSCRFIWQQLGGPQNDGLAGSCLWFRNGGHDITVRNSEFEKGGNDEILAFFADPNSNNEYCRWKNIYVYGNKMLYKVKNREGGYFNTILVSFSSSWREKYANKLTQWEDINFCNNIIDIEDLNVRTIQVWTAENDDIMGFRINGNTIIRDYVGTDTWSGSTSHDFWIKTWYRDLQRPECQNEPIEISHNNITLRQTLQNAGNGHHAVSLSGGKVNFTDNTVDGTGFSINNPSGGAAKSWMLFALSSSNIEASFDRNKCLGLGMLSNSNGNETVDNVSVSLRNNYLDGNISSYYPHLERLNFLFADNICENTGQLLLFNGFGTSDASQAIITGNTFSKAADVSTSSTNIGYFTKTYSLQKYILTNNTFFGYNSSALRTNWLTSGTPKLVDGNIGY